MNHTFVDLNGLPTLGRNNSEHRMALARLQVLWPLMCYHSLHGTIYGFAATRSQPLGLDRKEMLRWWAGYCDRGVLGAIPSGVQQKWKADLEELERRLADERARWLSEGDTYFIDSLREEIVSGRNGKLAVPTAAFSRYYASEDMTTTVAGAVRPYKGLSLDETADLSRRIGVCREVLLQPVLARRYTDEAIIAYGNDWGVSGAIIRHWLDLYLRDIGASTVAPVRLNEGMVSWLKAFESRILALASNDTRPSAWYWRRLTGNGASGLGVGVASKQLDPEAHELAKTRYAAVKIAVVQYLERTKRRRNNNQAGIARSLFISEQTLTNWKQEWAERRPMRPRLVTEAMAQHLDEMERVVAALGQADAQQVS